MSSGGHRSNSTPPTQLKLQKPNSTHISSPPSRPWDTTPAKAAQRHHAPTSNVSGIPCPRGSSTRENLKLSSPPKLLPKPNPPFPRAYHPPASPLRAYPLGTLPPLTINLDPGSEMPLAMDDNASPFTLPKLLPEVTSHTPLATHATTSATHP